MSEHGISLSAVFPFLLREEGTRTQILLHRRKNTGYQDGKWDIAASGHVDEGETATAAVIRECGEEIGIHVQTEAISFAHLSHRLGRDRTYYDLYFVVSEYGGTPSIMEPDKCSELMWFAMDELPEDMIPCRRQAVAHYLENRSYSEWKEG